MKRPRPTSETLHQQIREARYKFMAEGRERCCSVLSPGPPEILYLGRHESACLDQYAEQYFMQRKRMDNVPEVTRREYEGMQIFVVDAESHLDFGYL